MNIFAFQAYIVIRGQGKNEDGSAPTKAHSKFIGSKGPRSGGTSALATSATGVSAAHGALNPAIHCTPQTPIPASSESSQCVQRELEPQVT